MSRTEPAEEGVLCQNRGDQYWQECRMLCKLQGVIGGQESVKAQYPGKYPECPSQTLCPWSTTANPATAQ